MPEAPAVGFGDQVALLIEEIDVVDLLDGPAGKARLMFDDVLQVGFGGNRVVAANDLVPAPVGARPHRMDAGQPADMAGNDPARAEEEARQRDHVAELRLRRVFGDAPERIVVADAVRVVADVVARGLVAPWLGGHTDLHADALAQLVEPLLGDLRKRAFSRRQHGSYPSWIFQMARSRSRNTLRLTLPAGVFGSSGTKLTRRGYS